MKKIALLITLAFSSVLSVNNYAYAEFKETDYNAQTQGDNKAWTDRISNWYTKDFTQWEGNFIWTSNFWNEWIKVVWMRLWYDAKNAVITISIIFLMLMTIALLFSKDMWAESQKKWRMWIMWTIIWIMIIQISWTTMDLFYNKDFHKTVTVVKLYEDLLFPIIKLLSTLTSFVFLSMAIMSFYRIITAWWDDGKVKKWKDDIIYAVIWIFFVKVSPFLVAKTTWLIDWTTLKLNTDSWNPVTNQQITQLPEALAVIIKYINGFVWMATVVLIIFAWLIIMTANWDDAKVKKWKKIITYAMIWLFILAISYSLLWFYISLVK